MNILKIEVIQVYSKKVQMIQKILKKKVKNKTQKFLFT